MKLTLCHKCIRETIKTKLANFSLEREISCESGRFAKDTTEEYCITPRAAQPHIIHCPVLGIEIDTSPQEKPPRNCTYALEHLLQ